MEKTERTDLNNFEENLGYVFKDRSLLVNALTHSSRASEEGMQSNERLEFLGDAVLQLIISEYIYDHKKIEDEGVLSKMRALVVCSDSLAVTGKKLGVDLFLRLGKGEEMSGGRSKKNIIADAMESIIAAIFLDGGYAEAERFILSHHREIIEAAVCGSLKYDYKTTLQEYVQSMKLGELVYELVAETGPDHDKTFTSRAVIGKRTFPESSAHNKKQSENSAAHLAYEILIKEKQNR